jgi:hypothetical protein
MVGEALAPLGADRPILERSGLVRVSTTTPYNWQR